MNIGIVAPLDFVDQNSRFYFFQNRIILRYLYSTLREYGDVTLIHYKKPSIKIVKKYDFLFGFGFNFRHMAAKHKCLVCFEQHPAALKYFENKAIQYYKNIGYSLKSERSGTYYKSRDFERANSIIMLGDHSGYIADFCRYSENHKILEIPPVVLKSLVKPNYNSNSKKIVSILSRGDALKGLPMLLELAKRFGDYEFNILGRDDIETNLNNIRCHGFIDHKSNEYLDIIASSVINLNLSTSEACSTVVLDGLSLGIPFHTYGNLGLEKFTSGAYIQSNFDLDSTYSNILRFLNLNESEKLKMSARAYSSYKELTCLNYQEIITETVKNAISL